MTYAPAGLFLILLVSAGCGLVRREWVQWWAVAILLSGMASWLVWQSQHAAVIEPLNWWQGISIWPSELIRLLAACLSIAFIIHGIWLIDNGNRYLKRRYKLGGFAAGPAIAGNVFADCWPGRIRNFFQIPQGAATATCALMLQQIKNELIDMVRLLLCSGRRCGDTKENLVRPRNTEKDIVETFQRYAYPGMPAPKTPCRPWFQRWHGFLRGALFVLLYGFGTGAIMVYILGLEVPSIPARGDFAFKADRLILIVAGFAFLSLCFFALDRVSRAIWLARELDAEMWRYTRWPSSVLKDFRVGASGAIKFIQTESLRPYYSDWLDTHFIAQATEPVQKIIFYPFVILSLMIVARSRLFDGWHFSAFLIIGFAVISLLLIIATFRLRMMAEKVREQAVRRLNRNLVKVRGSSAPYSGQLAAQIEIMLRQVQELRIGAFAPVSQQPLFQAAMTVVSSLSGVQLLDHFGGIAF